MSDDESQAHYDDARKFNQVDDCTQSVIGFYLWWIGLFVLALSAVLGFGLFG